jgi:putative spermidine/putrescine transport system substrate-binding protein
MSRRDLLRRLGLSGAALTLPTGLLAACGGSQGGSATADTAPATTGGSPADLEGTRIKVATYGGFFEENFKTVYPDFTAETGIEVESVSEPGGDAWIVQLEQAVRSGGVPADVSLLGNTSVLRAVNGNVLMGMAESDLENVGLVADGFLRRNDAGDIIGVGAASWYITLVSNTDRVPESPHLVGRPVGRAVAERAGAEQPGELVVPARHHCRDVVRRRGRHHPDVDGGGEEVLAKLAEVKPNVKLWWRDEATAQQDYNSGEVSLGQFYHDITQYAASTGEPLRSVFPEEGAILDSGMWGITRTTASPAACVAFIDWMCTPAVQKRLSTTLGTSPTLALEHLDLTEEEYANVSGPGPDAAIKPAYDLYQSSEDELNQVWSEQIFSG